jgi:hypothetical protein
VYFVKSVFWFWSCSFFGFGHWGMLVVVDWLLVWSDMRASLMRRLGPWNSMRRPWWTMRSTIAAASLSSAKMVPHLPDPDVGGEDDAASFVGSGDDLVEQAGAVDVEGYVAEFVEDDQIGGGGSLRI